VAALQSTMQNKVFLTDLTSGNIPDVHANTVVADPPWYEDLTKSFLWAAAQIVEPRGFVFLSFPPIGTRPLVLEEWERVENFANDLGLMVRKKETSLKYESPPFEQNAMKAAQHGYVHSDWRPGVLVVFEKIGECRVARPVVRAQRECWTEQSLLGIRWKFRNSPVQSGSPMLKEIVPGDILDSVSRRDPRRAKADVWTSGNRIYSCENPQQLALITHALQAGIRPDTCIANSLGRKLGEDESQAVAFAAKQVASVTA